MFRDHFAAFERDAAHLGPDGVRRLAASYREWRDVLVAPLATVNPDAMRALGPVNDRIRHAIAAAGQGQVGQIDIEDATMAAWLALLAATDHAERSVIELLAGPWRQATTKLVGDQASGPGVTRTQLDRVTFKPVTA